MSDLSDSDGQLVIDDSMDGIDTGDESNTKDGTVPTSFEHPIKEDVLDSQQLPFIIPKEEVVENGTTVVTPVASRGDHHTIDDILLPSKPKERTISTNLSSDIDIDKSHAENVSSTELIESTKIVTKRDCMRESNESTPSSASMSARKRKSTKPSKIASPEKAFDSSPIANLSELPDIVPGETKANEAQKASPKVENIINAAPVLVREKTPLPVLAKQSTPPPVLEKEVSPEVNDQKTSTPQQEPSILTKMAQLGKESGASKDQQKASPKSVKSKTDSKDEAGPSTCYRMKLNNEKYSEYGKPKKDSSQMDIEYFTLIRLNGQVVNISIADIKIGNFDPAAFENATQIIKPNSTYSNIFDLMPASMLNADKTAFVTQQTRNVGAPNHKPLPTLAKALNISELKKAMHSETKKIAPATDTQKASSEVDKKIGGANTTASSKSTLPKANGNISTEQIHFKKMENPPNLLSEMPNLPRILPKTSSTTANSNNSNNFNNAHRMNGMPPSTSSTGPATAAPKPPFKETPSGGFRRPPKRNPPTEVKTRKSYKNHHKNSLNSELTVADLLKPHIKQQRYGGVSQFSQFPHPVNLSPFHSNYGNGSQHLYVQRYSNQPLIDNGMGQQMNQMHIQQVRYQAPPNLIQAHLSQQQHPSQNNVHFNDGLVDFSEMPEIRPMQKLPVEESLTSIENIVQHELSSVSKRKLTEKSEFQDVMAAFAREAEKHTSLRSPEPKVIKHCVRNIVFEEHTTCPSSKLTGNKSKFILKAIVEEARLDRDGNKVPVALLAGPDPKGTKRRHDLDMAESGDCYSDGIENTSSVFDKFYRAKDLPSNCYHCKVSFTLVNCLESDKRFCSKESCRRTWLKNDKLRQEKAAAIAAKNKDKAPVLRKEVDTPIPTTLKITPKKKVEILSPAPEVEKTGGRATRARQVLNYNEEKLFEMGAIAATQPAPKKAGRRSKAAVVPIASPKPVSPPKLVPDEIKEETMSPPPILEQIISPQRIVDTSASSTTLTPPSKDWAGLNQRTVETWTYKQVEEWVNSILSNDEGKRFSSEEIDGVALFMIDRDMLTKTLGLKVGWALKIEKQIAAMRAAP
uniref:SAM domain-containing protein n=1 Tax=Rhabditophanes sp. KR3021 TaxID=114890 RepID=A0AC35TIC4_9BILA